VQTLAEREAALAAAEQTTRQDAEVLEGRKRQTQEIVMQAALQEGQQASSSPPMVPALCAGLVCPQSPACIACMQWLLVRRARLLLPGLSVWLAQWLRRTCHHMAAWLPAPLTSCAALTPVYCSLYCLRPLTCTAGRP
jgi:hypothetical protein